MFLKLDDGKIFIQKLKEVMKDVHFNLTNCLENNKKKLEMQTFHINLDLLEILIGLVPNTIVDEKIINNFIDVCEKKKFKGF